MRNELAYRKWANEKKVTVNNKLGRTTIYFKILGNKLVKYRYDKKASSTMMQDFLAMSGGRVGKSDRLVEINGDVWYWPSTDRFVRVIWCSRRTDATEIVFESLADRSDRCCDHNDSVIVRCIGRRIERVVQVKCSVIDSEFLLFRWFVPHFR